MTSYNVSLWRIDGISIHTFLAEGDEELFVLYAFHNHFNPHLPRGRWPCGHTGTIELFDFNPHLPRGRWLYFSYTLSLVAFISIHTFLAEGDLFISDDIFEFDISIHTFLAEGDDNIPHILKDMRISIHTFLAEGDFLGDLYMQLDMDFNPHLPRGRWLSDLLFWYSLNFRFQSTPSSRKVTYSVRRLNLLPQFQSTPSSRKVTSSLAPAADILVISIHTFLAEGDFPL